MLKHTQIAGGKALPDEVVAQIVDRTDGVPLFVEELTRSVLESGLLREEGDRYVLDGALPPLAIPTSLHDSLKADSLAFFRKAAARCSFESRLGRISSASGSAAWTTRADFAPRPTSSSRAHSPGTT